jgi:hypothetical protein
VQVVSRHTQRSEKNSPTPRNSKRRRAWRRADKIRFKLCGGDYAQMHSVFPQLKPKGMRWLTYVTRLKLLEHFEGIGRSHFRRLAARLVEAG